MPTKPDISVQPGPGFRKVRNFVSIFRNQVENMAEDEMEEAAKEVATMVRSIIYRQAYKWKPLSKRYLAWKKRKGLDHRILIATKSYIQSIRAIPRRRDEEVVSWGVGPGHHNEIHKPSGLRLHTLGRMLEFGTKKMPARPHWRPAWSAYVRSKGRKLLTRMIKKALKSSR